MNSFVFIALVAILACVVIEGYGPVRRYGGHQHRPFRKFPHSEGPRHDSQQRPWREPHNHHHVPHHANFRHPPFWDDSPGWNDRSDSSSGSSEFDSGSQESFGPHEDDSFRHHHFGPPPSRDISAESKNRSESSNESDEFGSVEGGYWHHHHNMKRPCKRPNKNPSNTTPTNVPHTLPNSEAGTSTAPANTGNMGPSPRPAPIPTPSGSTSRPIRTTESNPGSSEESSPSEVTTMPAEEQFPTLSPEVESCLEACRSTPEYNPVCGTDGQTYINEGSLFCARSCGVDVSLRRRSVCPPPIFTGTFGPLPPTTPQTTVTTPTGKPRTLSPQFRYEQCMKQCPITPSVTPVCGTDIITYMNMDRLKCAQSCGADVEVLCEKPCVTCGYLRTTPTPTTFSSTTTQIGRTTVVPDVQKCMDTCPLTQENIPICGSNGVTYKNPGYLVCAQMCGIDVIAIRFSPCSSPTTLSTVSTSTTELPTTTMSPQVLNCIRICPVTTEYNPVCGTNDLTYTNIGNLECSKFCGVDVELQYKSRCLDEFDLGIDAVDSTTSEQTTSDLDTSENKVTTTSSTTAKTSSLFTSPTSTLVTSSTTSTFVRTTEAPVSTLPDIVLTLLPDEFMQVNFSSTTSQSPPTVKITINPDDDEDIDLDARFSNDNKTTSDYSKIILPK